MPLMPERHRFAASRPAAQCRGQPTTSPYVGPVANRPYIVIGSGDVRGMGICPEKAVRYSGFEASAGFCR